jgi:hypothetical protein
MHIISNTVAVIIAKDVWPEFYLPLEGRLASQQVALPDMSVAELAMV